MADPETILDDNFLQGVDFSIVDPRQHKPRVVPGELSLVTLVGAEIAEELYRRPTLDDDALRSALELMSGTRLIA